MSDDFSYPSFSLEEEDPNSRFLDLYNRFSSQYPDVGQYLQPDDPDIQKYQELASSPSGSEDIINEYYNSMPTREEYKPSFGRKMLATLLGTLSGRNAGEVASSFVQRPYYEAVNEWKMQGPGALARARGEETERTRELKALEFGLKTKAGTKKAEASEEMRKNAEARRLASEVEAGEARETARQDRIQRQQEIDTMRQTLFQHQKDMDEWRKAEAARDNTARDEARKKLDAEKAARAETLGAINKRLSDYASQQGVDTSDLTALDTAKELALKRAKAQNAFGGVLEQDPTTGRWNINEDDPRARLLHIYLNNLTQKLLRGEF